MSSTKMLTATALTENMLLRAVLTQYADPSNWRPEAGYTDNSIRDVFTLGEDGVNGYDLAAEVMRNITNWSAENPNIVVIAPTVEHVDAFISWLDGQGEQDWWIWEEARGLPQTRLTYDYDGRIVQLTARKD